MRAPAKLVACFLFLIVASSCQEQECNRELGYRRVGGSASDPRCERSVDSAVEEHDASPGEGDASDGGGVTGGDDAGARDASVDGGNVECGVLTTWFDDTDGDGYGDPEIWVMACVAPAGYAGNDVDDDPKCGRPAASARCAPGAERCADGTVGDREVCAEDALSPGCTDWIGASKCSGSAPVCTGDGECGKCSTDTDCTAFGQVCDTVAGSCVQCTPATEVAQCADPNPNDAIAAPACDPNTNTCTARPRQSVSGCGACVTDSECIAGSRCLQMTFGSEPHGSYCLEAAPSGLCASPAPTKKSGVSALGVPGDYCFPRELLTTCEAIISFGTPCASDSECGATGTADGLCIGALGAKRCTYRCSGDGDCNGTTCIGPLSGKYCDPS